MITLLKTETKDISPKTAEAMLAANTFDGQRRLRNDWVAELSEQITSGDMAKIDIALALNGAADAKPILMNGQHSLSAVVKAGRGVKATVDTYSYSNEGDLWRLFGRFDVFKPRTEANVMTAAKGRFKNADIRNLPVKFLAACGTALYHLGGNGTKPAFGKRGPGVRTRKAELVEKYSADVLNASQYLISSKYMPVPICICMIATFRLAEEKALEFWNGVMHGDRIPKGSAQWHLRNLVQAGIAKEVPHGGGNRPRYQYNICASWWNSFITGETRRSVKVSSIKGVVDLFT